MDKSTQYEVSLTHPNDGAFASSAVVGDGKNFDYAVGTFGLTKREYFAAAALTGIISLYDQDSYSPEEAAIKAIEAAEILISVLNDK